MPGTEGSDPSAGELSRRLREVLTQFESLVRTIEERYVRKDILELYKEGENSRIAGLQSAIEGIKNSFENSLLNKCDKNDCVQLDKRVASLEEWNKWLVRIIIAFVVAGVLAAAFASGGSVK